MKGSRPRDKGKKRTISRRGVRRLGADADRRLLCARDVMTSPPITVSAETPVVDVARLMLEHAISAVPVVDAERMVGIVSEGDLVRRSEIGTERQRSWWLALVTGPEILARDYVRTHGQRAEDVMTSEVVTVGEDAPLPRIAQLLEEHRIKRVPVVRGGRVVGIVSRADLLRALMATREPQGRALTTAVTDAAIRARLQSELSAAAWVTPGFVNPLVVDGVVHLWGLVDSDTERRALRAMAARIEGVRAVEDHLRRGL